MRRPVMDDVVGWRIEPQPRVTRLARGVLAAMGGVLMIVFQDSGAWPFQGRAWVPCSAEEPMPVDTILARGSASWLPGARWGAVGIELTGLEALIQRGDARVTLPLHDLTITSARPLTSPPHRRRPNARWELHVSDGASDLTLTGSWLPLAWSGTLAGWPEPL